MAESRRQGWRVHWDHPNGRDQFCGDLWDTVEDAEYVACGVRRAGMLNVRVQRGSEPMTERLVPAWTVAVSEHSVPDYVYVLDAATPTAWPVGGFQSRLVARMTPVRVVGQDAFGNPTVASSVPSSSKQSTEIRDPLANGGNEGEV